MKKNPLQSKYLVSELMTFQDAIEISTRGRGTTEITAEVARIVSSAKIERGIAHVFAPHTSCSVIITENADPTVRRDLEMLAQSSAPDGDAEYRRCTGGGGDTAAHARNVLGGISFTNLSPAVSAIKEANIRGTLTCGKRYRRQRY